MTDGHASFPRPQGKSYLFFTQFKAELKGAKIEYANAYVSTCAKSTQTLYGNAAFSLHK